MDLSTIRHDIELFLNENPSKAPLMIRFAWHNCATFDKVKQNGGSNGCTMRFDAERNDPENKGFSDLFDFFDNVKRNNTHITISLADLYILGGYVAIEWSGGPKIAFATGRQDHPEHALEQLYGPSRCPFGDGEINPNGSRLPPADMGQDLESAETDERAVKEAKTIDAIRRTFDRMGFNDKETVCLIVFGHQYGEAKVDVSGYEGLWHFFPYDYNISGGGYLSMYNHLGVYNEVVLPTGKRQFEFKTRGVKLMMLPVDMALSWDPIYRQHIDYYIGHRQQLREDAAKCWKKLTELGCTGLLTPENR